MFGDPQVSIMSTVFREQGTESSSEGAACGTRLLEWGEPWKVWSRGRNDLTLVLTGFLWLHSEEKTIE